MTVRNKRIIKAAAAAVLLTVVGLITALFTGIEHKTNTFTVGKVSLSLDEDYSSGTFIPGQAVSKNPRITNNGKNDEYVFLTVTIPKANITLLYDKTDEQQNTEHKNGTIKEEKAVREVVRLIANSTDSSGNAVNVSYTDNSHDISYHGKGDNTAGWVYVSRDTSEDDYNTYVFAYSKALSKNETTSTLFDSIQLKKYIDGEFSGEAEIDVKAYGIQADNLGDDMTKKKGTDSDEDFFAELYKLTLRESKS